ncbi:hypothetical protein [Pseudonocardia parietis]|uniref:Dentin sialophosphoprotein n=1 Tax=Pseudonocardia parietis TaxID=570936 RepID=A0ABS4VMI8_9PSEU|nr:hypothetical protein [Pseudonocardia parietis]MBP2364958.1 hypothetical protein [Pseudonocardia parietis]
MATESISLIDFLKKLLAGDSESIQLRDWFQENPQAVLHHYGLDEYTPDDVHDAIVLMQDNDTVSFDRNYDTGFDGGKGGWDWDGGKDGGKEGGHHEAATHEKVHVEDNYFSYDVDDRDTVVDNSVNQNVDTDGGDFRQQIETNSVTASGDGAVAAGGDIEDSTITSGDGNIVGDGNQVVSGDDNTVAFGDGSAYEVGDVSADNGAGISFGGNASGNDSVEDSYNETTTTTTNTTETDFEDSFNTTSDDSESNTNTDSFNSSVGSGNDVEADLDLTVG